LREEFDGVHSLTMQVAKERFFPPTEREERHRCSDTNINANISSLHLIPELAIRDLQLAATAMETYLTDWQTRLDELDSHLGEFERLVFLGRGASMSAVWNGSLINKEAARSSFEGLHAADFRHGPLELVSDGFVAVIFAGSLQTADLNRRLALEIISYGGRVLWADSSPDPELPTLLLPQTPDLARPLMEILPLQILTLVIAKHKGLQAGQFRHVGKVTDTE
jgi:glucosamine--fructose-6-phosphate aminotransferase (isomerizing)